jgi:hypothetical protein
MVHELRSQSMFIFLCDIKSLYGDGRDEKGGWRPELDTFLFDNELGQPNE